MTTDATASLEDLALLTAGASMWGTANAAGAPAMMLADGPMGVASGRVDERDVSILSPCPTALGATFDREVVRSIGEVIGEDAVARGVDALLGPNLNLARSPLAGRNFEFFSEDPYLIGALGAAWIEGLQATGTGAVAKHAVCNDSETQRDRMSALIDEAPLRETYLLPFEMAASADCVGMLLAYNRLNGVHCVEHPGLISIIKQDWNFAGFTVSDWFGTRHGAASAKAGLDLEMPGPGSHLGAKFTDLVHQGLASEERLRDAAERVARAADRVCGVKRQDLRPDEIDERLVHAAAEGLVLLRNEKGLLPFQPDRIRSIAVIGPNAVSPCFQGGTFAKIALDPDTPTPLQALRDHLGDRFAVAYAQGCLPEPRLPAFLVAPTDDLGDGQKMGFSLRYYASQDLSLPPVARETRNTNSLTWFARTGIAAVVDADAAIVASGLYTPLATGAHRLLVGATGSVTVRVDGELVFSRALELAPGDIMGRLKANDADSVALTFPDLAPRLFEIEFRYRAGRVQGLWFGMEGPDLEEARFQEAESLAGRSDAVVLMLGETSDASVESKDRTSTQISDRQKKLAARVLAANPNCLVVVNVGQAFDANFAEGAAGLMLALYPGQGFARALAETLSGLREPGGRLPITLAAREADYPVFDLTPDDKGDVAYSEGSVVGHRHFSKHGIKPLFAFGSGRGYADFALKAARIVGDAVQVTVTNLSAREGKVVVQVFAKDAERSYPVLVGFMTQRLPGGETRDLAVPLCILPLRVWTGDGWRPPAGPVQLLVGTASDRLAFELASPTSLFSSLSA